MRGLFAVVAGLGLLATVWAEPPQAPAAGKAASVVVTGELACLHCHFGIGDGCAVALKVDDKTPLVLDGEPAKELFKKRFKKETVVVEGDLRLKDKQMTLVAAKSRAFDAKSKDPAPGTAFVSGEAVCGKCDLGKCDSCTLAVSNGDYPVILDGKLAEGHAHGLGTLLVTGKLKIDGQGLLRLDASKVDGKK